MKSQGDALVGGAAPEVDLLAEVPIESFPTLLRKSMKRSQDFFVGNYGLRPSDIRQAMEIKLKLKIDDEYAHIPEMGGTGRVRRESSDQGSSATSIAKMLEGMSSTNKSVPESSALATTKTPQVRPAQAGQAMIRSSALSNMHSSNVLANLEFRNPGQETRPTWHPPWKLMRVIAGHQGWVRCLALDPNNEWFASGGNDRLIKIWDLASGTLKLTLTGHINNVRALAVSDRHPYLFSCAEDNKVKCWDLEYNSCTRQYHGHLSGVYCLAVHPGLDLLATGGRDAVVRVWDMRTQKPIHVLSGHTGTVMSLISQKTEPQFVSGSLDKMIRLWDLAAGKCMSVLTNHKRSIRSMVFHPREYTFCSAGADCLKVWKCPLGNFERNIEGAGTILNTIAVKDQPDSSVIFGGSDQGYMCFWDWASGYKFQMFQSIPQPGSLSGENGIFHAIFDRSETRLLTADCDKTIKVWKEDPDATPETHPINWKPSRKPSHF